nr:replication protein A 70 kDa DNA-binding subunit D-like [Ipomoea batatas]
MAIEKESIASDLPASEHQQRNTCVEKHMKQTKEYMQRDDKLQKLHSKRTEKDLIKISWREFIQQAPLHSTINCMICISSLADLSHRRRVCSGVVQETADQPSTVVDVSPAVASAQPRRRFPPPSRLLPGTVASQPSVKDLKGKQVSFSCILLEIAEKVDTDLQLRSLARLNGEAVTPTGSGSDISPYNGRNAMKVRVVRSYVVPEKKGSTVIKSKEVVFHDYEDLSSKFGLKDEDDIFEGENEVESPLPV